MTILKYHQFRKNPKTSLNVGLDILRYESHCSKMKPGIYFRQNQILLNNLKTVTKF